jgi:hypothetical protein
MSVRAVFIGLVAVVLIITLDLFNRVVWHLPMDFSTHLPTGVYALLMVVVLGINPVLHLLHRNWRLKAGELAVVLGMALASCHVAGVGFMTQVPQLLVMPLQLVQVDEGWQRHQLMSYIPPAMLVNDAQATDTREIVNQFIVGKGGSAGTLPLASVPWGAWSTTLSFWLPTMVLMGIASVAMALIVHRQWSVNERLRYPLADFAASLIQQDQDFPLGPIYRNRMFWIGLGGLLAIHMANYLSSWFPQYSVQIPLAFDFSAVTNRWPDLGRIFVDQFIPHPTVYPMVAGFAYLLASDVGLSLWSSHLVYGIFKLILITAGAVVSNNFILGGFDASTRFGAFMGTAVILLYTGRRYYGQVLRRAFTGRGGETAPWTGWAFWCAVLPAAAVTTLLINQGLDWPLAVGSVLMLLVMYLVVSRMSAEAGLYFIRAGWMPISVFWGLMGGSAIGIQDLFILGLLSMVLCLDTVECLMPYVVNSLRVADLVGVRAQRIGKSMSLGFVVALGLAAVITLWGYYNYGAPADDWTLTNLPGRAFLAPYRTATQLSLGGMTQTVANYSPLERFRHIQTDATFRRFIGWTAFGLGSVLVLGAMRLRFTWWPLHPILVLVWGSWPMGVCSFSVLLGWLVKIAVTRLGGVRLYRTVKPMMIGVIAADALSALIQMAVGAIRYQIAGLAR